jgi:spore maturation protein SpmB
MFKGYDAVCPGVTVCVGVMGVIAKSITARRTVWVLGAGAPAEVAETVTLYCPPGVAVVVPTVIVTVTGALAVGFTVAEGEKPHVTPAAGALHESVTAPAKLPIAVTCVVTVEFPPGKKPTLFGDGVPRVKSATVSVSTCVFGAGAPGVLAEIVRLYWPSGVAVVVATVMVTVTGVLDVGFTVADGEKLQVTAVAGVLHDSVTAPEKLPSALT